MNLSTTTSNAAVTASANVAVNPLPAPTPSTPAQPTMEQVIAACETYETASITVAAVLRLEGFSLQTIRHNGAHTDPKRNEKFFVMRVPAGQDDVQGLVGRILNDEVLVKPNAFRNMISNLRNQITELFPERA